MPGNSEPTRDKVAREHQWFDARTCTCGASLKHNLEEHRQQIRQQAPPHAREEPTEQLSDSRRRYIDDGPMPI